MNATNLSMHSVEPSFVAIVLSEVDSLSQHL